jgi:hypothetical protein
MNLMYGTGHLARTFEDPGALLPILDNQAILGACMNQACPERPSSTESVYSQGRIRSALEWIWAELVATANQEAWQSLHELEPARSRIELFGMVWGMHFQQLPPVWIRGI